MAKPKQRHQVPTPGNKHINPSDFAPDIDGEYDWVIVKKQKVTILIPPLPVTKQPAMPNPEPNQPQAKPGKATNVQTPLIKPNLLRHSDTDGEKSVSTTREKTIRDLKKPFASQPISPTPGILKPGTPQPKLRSKLPVVDNFGYNRMFRVCGASKLNKKSKSFCDGNLLLHQSLRASILERKLRKAGGLSRWLASLGLDQFVKIFKGRRVSKFQLVNLNMKKLKDMGAVPVGPRRKLMHSIDCLCQPICFEAL